MEKRAHLHACTCLWGPFPCSVLSPTVAWSWTLWLSPHPQTLLSQIEKADLRDEGVYTCSATNLAGESKKDVTLKVLGEDRPSMGSKTGWLVTPRGSLGLGVEDLDSQLYA